MFRKRNQSFIFSLAVLIVLFSIDARALIGPVKRGKTNEPSLTNCSEIRMVKQHIDLYHHPLGIWQVTCNTVFSNQSPKKVTVEMGATSGFDIGMIEGDFYCDEYNNFRVYIEGNEEKKLSFTELCPNYVDRIGMEWTNDDNSGIGFLNTWVVTFQPEETKEVLITFNFIVTKPNIVYRPELKEQWYVEQTSWLRREYGKRAENDFKLPLSMGSFWALFVDSLVIRTYYSNQWLSMEKQEDIKYVPGNIHVNTFSEPLGFYSPLSGERNVLTSGDLRHRSQAELKLLRNSFFAKYGRTFTDKFLKLYFDKQPWYVENQHYDNWYLTEWDIENVRLIYDHEQRGKSE